MNKYFDIKILIASIIISLIYPLWKIKNPVKIYQYQSKISIPQESKFTPAYYTSKDSLPNELFKKTLNFHNHHDVQLLTEEVAKSVQLKGNTKYFLELTDRYMIITTESGSENDSKSSNKNLIDSIYKYWTTQFTLAAEPITRLKNGYINSKKLIVEHTREQKANLESIQKRLMSLTGKNLNDLRAQMFHYLQKDASEIRRELIRLQKDSVKYNFIIETIDAGMAAVLYPKIVSEPRQSAFFKSGILKVLIQTMMLVCALYIFATSFKVFIFNEVFNKKSEV